jgi:hypothetical protein
MILNSGWSFGTGGFLDHLEHTASQADLGGTAAVFVSLSSPRTSPPGANREACDSLGL